MAQRLNILILGYGEMGHAMEYLLAEHHQLAIWDKYPTNNFKSADFESSAIKADIVLFCLPVNPHREIAKQISSLLKRSCLCISIAKGLDETGQTAAQIFSDIFKFHQPYALLYGPMISEEIIVGRLAFAQLGCNDTNSFSRVHEAFYATNLFIEDTTDIAGISWSVILKNVYALAFGMADELNLGDNMRGYLTVAALRELEQIVHIMGGKEKSPYHLAGLGDLITTATSENSHHHELGRKLARGDIETIKGEGIHTLKMVSQHHLFDINSYPLFILIHDIVEQPSDVKQKISIYIKDHTI